MATFLPPNLQPPLSHIHLLPYGIDRLLAAAAAFNFPAVTANLTQGRDRATSLAREIQTHILQTHGELNPVERFIIRISFRRDGKLRLMSGPRPHVPGVEYYPTSLPPPGQSEDDVPVIPIHLDPGHVPSSLFTRHKTSHRAEYNAARARVGFDDSVTFAQGRCCCRTNGE
ncbi:hypothetical protein GE09DRAFT_1218644 [Coniochaeta sp. 2T2.1]|nr:hypothetical protein GE09DRAFT_1218644 [Coniochaeta sp. 2T2.1]